MNTMRVRTFGVVLLVACAGSDRPTTPTPHPDRGLDLAAANTGRPSDAAPSSMEVPPAVPADAPLTIPPDAPATPPDATAVPRTRPPGVPMRVVARDIGSCPNTPRSRPIVEPPAACPALAARFLRAEGTLRPSSPAHVELRSPDELRSQLGCDAPATFDWTRDQIVALTLIFDSGSPARIEGMAGNVLWIGTEHLCQGTRSVAMSEIVLIAVPASSTLLRIEYCDEPHAPCGAVP
jgi:hypothetical protein